MSTSMNAQSNGQQRNPRRGKKSKNPHTASGTASPVASSQFAVPAQNFYDGSSEPTPSIVSHRKQHSRAHMSDANGYPSHHNFQKQPNRARGSSQSYPVAQPASHGTPIKSTAYAGPTFHASPAASSLPIPKLFSKSLPEQGATLPASLVAEDSDVGQTDPEDTAHNTSFTPESKNREPSPLDFLFDAARKARDSGDGRSLGFKSGNLSPSDDSRSVNGSETPTNRPGVMFPLELDGNSTVSSSIGPAFATPYKDRMNAYKSQTPSRPNSEGNLNDEERIAKAEALKKLLGHSPSPKPSGASYNLYDTYRPSLQRPHSGPNTPTHFGPLLNAQPRSAAPTPPSGDFPFRDIIPQRPPSSKLRQEMSPDSHSMRPIPNAVYGNGSPSPSRTPRPMDPKRLEDDLRRVLKLDATG